MSTPTDQVKPASHFIFETWNVSSTGAGGWSW
jgi:hypothetical protein